MCRVISRSSYRSEGRQVPMWYVYFLELANKNIYVGSTNNLKRRFSSHTAGNVLSTRGHLPIKLKTYVAVETETLARNLEKYLKSGSGKAFAKNGFGIKAEPAMKLHRSEAEVISSHPLFGTDTAILQDTNFIRRPEIQTRFSQCLSLYWPAHHA